MDEIINAMLIRLETGDEGRPGGGALRRRGCAEPAKVTAIFEGAQIGQSVPMPFAKRGIHAVDA